MIAHHFWCFRLTAYAVKSLSQANKYIYIDPDILDKGIKWIMSKQNSDGSFEEPGEVHHKALQVCAFDFHLISDVFSLSFILYCENVNVKYFWKACPLICC